MRTAADRTSNQVRCHDTQGNNALLILEPPATEYGSWVLSLQLRVGALPAGKIAQVALERHELKQLLASAIWMM